MKKKNDWIMLLFLLLFCLISFSSSSSNPGGMVIRFRLQDGSISKVQVPPGKENTWTLSQILNQFDTSTESSSIHIPSSNNNDDNDVVVDPSQSLAQLSLRHGSLVIIRELSSSSNQQSKNKRKKSKNGDWIPFPNLARDYHGALRQSARTRGTRRGMTFTDLSNIQSSLHIVTPQSEGPITRIYICQTSAQRFQQSIPKQIITTTNDKNKKKKKKKNKTKQQQIIVSQNRVGLLLGTFHRERVKPSKNNIKTSLSSTTQDEEYCFVAKVHAIWDPPTSKMESNNNNNMYNVEPLMSWNNDNDSQTTTTTEEQEESDVQRVIRVAGYLKLLPLGWIFTFSDNRRNEDDALPVWAKNVQHGAQLQMQQMKRNQKMKNDNNPLETLMSLSKTVTTNLNNAWITLAMNAHSGETEAFQLSNIAVQMVSEDILDFDAENENNNRFVSTKHDVPILIDEKETTRLDSVLCLINTAMLSHQGLYSGGTETNSLKQNGRLLTKVKRNLLKALQTSNNDNNETTTNNNDDNKLLKLLCNFQILLAIDTLWTKEESERLCRVVQKWARGQKRGTKVPPDLKVKLESILSR